MLACALHARLLIFEEVIAAALDRSATKVERVNGHVDTPVNLGLYPALIFIATVPGIDARGPCNTSNAASNLMPADPSSGLPVEGFAYGLSTVGAPLLRLFKTDRTLKVLKSLSTWF